MQGYCVRSSDCADGESSEGEHDVPQQRGVEADLGMIEPEVFFAELEASSTGQRRQASWTRTIRVTGRPDGTWQ